ncbi:uncharacterized protein [Montipora foliosa]|uniref:uncharacterized protein n=1 Tax=Montipora foliosa TaxID=591990 RepID=UPI0035F1598B
MDFKASLLCFALFVVAASGGPVCKCGPENNKDSVSEYTVKVHNGREEVDEKITIDAENETETLYIKDDGAPGEVYAIFDFKRNLSLYQISHPNVCFLSNSTGSQPKPADFIKLLKSGSTEPKEAERTNEYSLVREVHDRSFLSDEMAIMCAKQRIFYIKPVDVQKKTNKKRRKRDYCVIIITDCCITIICYHEPVVSPRLVF